MIRKRTQEEMKAYVEGFIGCYNRLLMYFAGHKTKIEIMEGMEAAIQVINSRVREREGEQKTREEAVERNKTDASKGRDAIRRRAAIDAICATCADDGEHYQDCWIYKMGKCCDISAIEAIPPEEPPAKYIAEIKIDTEDLVERIRERYYIQEWIPTSEHLPELKDDGVSDEVLLCWSDGQVVVGTYAGDRTFVGQGWPKATGATVKVVAWMPIPEPYVGGEDE